MIHTQLVSGDPNIVHLGLKFFVSPILATIFIFPLFAFSVNLIVGNNESFGYDDSSFKRKLFFILMMCQFIPIIISVGLMVGETVPVGSSQMLLIEQLIANLLFLLSSLTLKIGNYQKDEDSF